MALIEITDLTKHYQSGGETVEALRGVTFTVEAGEFVTIMGQSGSGKSTLLSILGGMNHPTGGAVEMAGVKLYDLPGERLADFRAGNLGFIFQSFHLIPYLTALENVLLPLAIAGAKKGEKIAVARGALGKVGLGTKIDRLPNQLSGGEQERVAIARAIVNNPRILFADEPTGNLDSKTAESVFALFNDLAAKGKTIIIVTHDSGLAKRTQRTALISDGELVNEYVAKAMPTLTQEQMLQVTRTARSILYEPGAMILAEGTNANGFYVVSKGTVEVVLPRPDRSDVVAVQLGPGKFFGEMEFFHDQKHRASVRATDSGPVEVLALNYEQLNELLSQSLVTREALQRSAQKHEMENIALREVTV